MIIIYILIYNSFGTFFKNILFYYCSKNERIKICTKIIRIISKTNKRKNISYDLVSKWNNKIRSARGIQRHCHMFGTLVLVRMTQQKNPCHYGAGSRHLASLNWPSYAMGLGTCCCLYGLHKYNTQILKDWLDDIALWSSLNVYAFFMFTALKL